MGHKEKGVVVTIVTGMTSSVPPSHHCVSSPCVKEETETSRLDEAAGGWSHKAAELLQRIGYLTETKQVVVDSFCKCSTII